MILKRVLKQRNGETIIQPQRSGCFQSILAGTGIGWPTNKLKDMNFKISAKTLPRDC
jgi:hypothetical protein